MPSLGMLDRSLLAALFWQRHDVLVSLGPSWTRLSLGPRVCFAARAPGRQRKTSKPRILGQWSVARPFPPTKTHSVFLELVADVQTIAHSVPYVHGQIWDRRSALARCRRSYRAAQHAQ